MKIPTFTAEVSIYRSAIPYQRVVSAAHFSATTHGVMPADQCCAPCGPDLCCDECPPAPSDGGGDRFRFVRYPALM